MSNELRSLIRKIIEQELSASTTDKRGSNGVQGVASDFRPAGPAHKEETVRLSSDQDVAVFVRRILELADEPAGRQALTSGQHQFRLINGATVETQDTLTEHASEVHASGVSRVEHGLLTERECGRLAPDITLLVIGASVRVTPLAADWLRRKGITIKRAES